jgi:hypothetical protein
MKANASRPFALHMAHTLGEDGLFAGLDQRAVAAGALQQLEEAE